MIAGKIDFDVSAGDLLFFGKTCADGLKEAIIKSISSENLFHVGMIKDHRTLIHATTEGVEEISLEAVIRKEEPSFLEVCRVNATDEEKRNAIAYAESAVGLPYNDIFSVNGLNSAGKESLYCSQLVTKAYENTSVKFPDHKMKFGSADGEVLHYWVDYYAQRNCSVPVGEPGSHPGQIRKSEQIERLGIIQC